MFLFKNYCCAFSLRTGATTVGWFSLFFRFSLLIGFSCMLIMERIHLAEVASAKKDARGPNPNEEPYVPTCSLYPEERREYWEAGMMVNRSDLPPQNETGLDEGVLSSVIRSINFNFISHSANWLLGPANQTETFIDQTNVRSRREILVEEADIVIVDPDLLEEVFKFEVLLGRVVLSTISTCTSILLIVGALKGCVSLLLPWITSELLNTLLEMVWIITKLSGSYNGKREVIMTQTFGIVLGIFNLLVVLSYCKEIERNEKRKQIVEEKPVHVV